VSNPCAYLKFGGHTCVSYKETDSKVFAVAMSSPELAMIKVDVKAFHEEWKPIQGCDASMAADRYLKGNMPYSDEVKTILERIKKMETTQVAKPPAKGAVNKGVVSVRPGADLPSAIKGKAAAKPAAPAAAKPAEPKKLTAEERKASEKAFFNGEGGAATKPPAGKQAKAEKDATAVKPPKAAKAPKLEDTDVIKLLKGAENRRGNAESIRSQVFAKIKEGITVGAVVKACAKFTNEKQVLSDLVKLANHPTNPVISFSKKK